ncbi:MAG: 4-alpha-glucanotransferase [Deltaproteobacteria bacterium]|nr:MAG: 4-alpha-glucanotransferase [Deltaproteobacteria bacterium]
MSVFDRRRSGLLLHLSSLPAPYGIGDMGRSALAFLDFLREAGQSIWQILPIHPTGYGNSPYSACSTFAGNPLFIDIDGLVADGDLLDEDVAPWRRDVAATDYDYARRCRRELLPLAARRFQNRANWSRQAELENFCAEQAGWLDDYVLFQALRETFGYRSWDRWPTGLRDREQQTLELWRARLATRIAELKYEQFVFFRQWQRLRSAAAEKNILLFGDLPIYIAHDSADTWCHRDLFRLDGQGRPEVVAGVPPDYFSATGQLWGNPLYCWQRHLEQDFGWWRTRVRQTLGLFDLVRVDHFRALAACWAIPADAPDARGGHWEDSPGDALLAALQNECGELPLVAEDLGVITDDVVELRRRWRLPGMRILQFAFDSGPDNPYLPENHTVDSVIYTGTHDNDTCLGWWQGLDAGQRQKVLGHLKVSESEVCRELISQALTSVGIISILPVQDLLGLGSEARMNRPGRPGGNWTWRLPDGCLTGKLARELHEMTSACGRTAATQSPCPVTKEHDKFAPV